MQLLNWQRDRAQIKFGRTSLLMINRKRAIGIQQKRFVQNNFDCFGFLSITSFRPAQHDLSPIVVRVLIYIEIADSVSLDFAV